MSTLAAGRFGLTTGMFGNEISGRDGGANRAEGIGVADGGGRNAKSPPGQTMYEVCAVKPMRGWRAVTVSWGHASIVIEKDVDPSPPTLKVKMLSDSETLIEPEFVSECC